MINSAQIITDKKGKTIAVQIPMSKYKKLLLIAEEMDEIKAFDKAIKRKHEFIPLDQVVKELKAKRK